MAFDDTANTSPLLELTRPKATGGLIVALREGQSAQEEVSLLENAVGTGVRAVGLSEMADVSGLESERAVVIPELDIGLVRDQFETQEAANIRTQLMAADAVDDVRPEFYLYPIQQFQDTSAATWGLQATRTLDSQFTGKGIKIAVLDTGLDLNHPDFVGRNIVSQSFVAGEHVQDLQGHGTHCCGTAAGGTADNGQFRYGVASNAELYVGKVLSNSGSGRESDIILGAYWAINAGCSVVSMSLGRAVAPGEPYSQDYERLGRYALSRESLIIAAAGNDSDRRFNYIAPVGAPANSPSIMAVAAVDPFLQVADFSCGGINGNGGEVDIAGPGVHVISSLPMPRQYGRLSGTSMACPHVAGIAALWAESNPQLRGQALWNELMAQALSLNDPQRDVGSGLVQAPVAQAGV